MLTVIAIILTFAMITSIYAQRGPREYREYMKPKFSAEVMDESEREPHPRFEDLNLNDDQKDQLYELKTKLAKDMNDYEHTLRNAEIDLRDLLKKEEYKKAKSKIDEIMDIKADMWKRRLSFGADVMDILTEEQKEKLGDFPIHWGMKMMRNEGRGPFRGHKGMRR